MSKPRQSDEERITAWFSAADPLEVRVLYRVIKGILVGRNIDVGTRKVTSKKRGPNKPKNDPQMIIPGSENV
jgi:hypothetical protein